MRRKKGGETGPEVGERLKRGGGKRISKNVKPVSRRTWVIREKLQKKKLRWAGDRAL